MLSRASKDNQPQGLVTKCFVIISSNSCLSQRHHQSVVWKLRCSIFFFSQLHPGNSNSHLRGWNKCPWTSSMSMNMRSSSHRSSLVWSFAQNVTSPTYIQQPSRKPMTSICLSFSTTKPSSPFKIEEKLHLPQTSNKLQIPHTPL